MSESTPPPPPSAPASKRPPAAVTGASATRRRKQILTLVGWAVSVLALLGLLYYAYDHYVLRHTEPTISWVRNGTQYELLNPKLLGFALVIPWFFGVISRSLADLPWPQRILSVLLRCAFVALIALGLSRLARTATTEKTCTVYIVDVSNSVPDEALADAQAAIDKAEKDKPEDGEIRVVTFAKRPRVVEPDKDGKLLVARHGDPTESGNPGDEGAGSNLQAALQLSYGLFPPGYLKRAVLYSDGAQTDGDVLAEANRAKEHGIHLFTVPYTRPVPGEVAVQELHMPDHVKVGETFEVKAEIYASRATKARGRLYQGEALNGLEGVKDLDLKAGPNEVVWKSVVRYAGPVTYALEVDQIADDKFAENNKVASTIDVPGRPSVLYVEGTPEQANPLSSALTAQQFDVDIRPPVGFPGSLKELERYDFVILSDVGKDQLEINSQDLIEKYVRDLGGGFLFAGGELGYGLGGWNHTTMERMLPVRMDNKNKEEMPAVAMALVIDRSGSMTGLPMEMAKSAAKATVGVLSPDDLVEVIAFDSSPTRYVKLQPARNRTRIGADIARIQPGGGTEIFSALNAAFEDMTVAQARRKHVILLTDGRAPTAGIKELVASMVAENITVTSVGLGNDLDEQLLKTIADTGGGRFHAVADPNNLPRVFTKETELIARAAAVEEWFPVTQTGYAQFLAGLDIRSAPYLHGYVSTELKPSPAEQILASDTDEPILARWRVGLGWSIAWTSDVKARWAVEWLRWPGWEKFWGQLVREHMRQKHTRELDMKAEISGGILTASVDAFTPDERFENNLTSRLTITGPEPNGTDKVVDLRQIAPGRYEASVPMDKYGSFLLKAEHLREQADGTQKVVAVSYGHVSNPYPREYATFQPDRALLEHAALAGGGTMDPPDVKTIFDPAGEKVTYHEELWNKFIFAAIAVFLLDLFVRRVRLFDRKFVAKTRRAY
ncbi:MAG TPA: VWA domain-containing protein [Polyangiaceae bacterium]|nr:VWA domain-containing protein [Polyangiaceae bacterium]